MPNLIGTHRALLADAVIPATANTLTIVGGNINPLINAGEQQLSVVDQNSNPVTPDSWSSGTPGNVTVTSAGLIRGVAESGTSVISAIKSGYTTGTITVTLSGGIYYLDPNTLSQTNGQAVSSLTDSGSVAWTQATGAKQPTCFVDATSGRKSLLFTAANSQYLQTAAHVTALEGANLSLFMVTKPVTVNVTQYLYSNSSAGTSGWLCDLFTDNKFYLAVATGFTGVGGGTALSTSVYSRIGFTTSATAQAVYLNGASIGTASNTYTSGAQGAGPLMGALTTGSGFYGGYIGLTLSYNRVITTAEIAQVDLRLANEATALAL